MNFRQGNNGDLILQVGQLVQVTGDEEKKQKITNRLKIFRGEFFGDVRIGMPWFQVVLQKNPNLAIVRALILQCILSVEGVEQVTSFTLDLDTQTRVLSARWIAKTIAGTEISGGLNQDSAWIPSLGFVEVGK